MKLVDSLGNILGPNLSEFFEIEIKNGLNDIIPTSIELEVLGLDLEDLYDFLEEEAKKMVIESTNIEPDECKGQEYEIPPIDGGTLEVRSLTSKEKFAYGVLGGA